MPISHSFLRVTRLAMYQFQCLEFRCYQDVLSVVHAFSVTHVCPTRTSTATCGSREGYDFFGTCSISGTQSHAVTVASTHAVTLAHKIV